MDDFSMEILLEIGEFTQKLRKEVFKKVKENVSISSIVEFVENSIIDKGYKPAFPCTVCINDVAAHYTFYDEDYFLKKGDLVKVDFGINCEGNITDNAFTVEVGTKKYENLLNANKRALDLVLEKIEPGQTLNEIGEIVYNVASENKFDSIHNLSGHQMDINDLHCGLHIPNYPNGSLKTIPKTALIAIEPFLTTGDPLVKAVGNSNILHLVNFKPIRDPIAKKILIYIVDNYPKLPFSKRWLLKEFDKRKVDYAIKILKINKIIHEYDILASKNSNYISQFEETVLFIDGKKHILTRQKNERS